MWIFNIQNKNPRGSPLMKILKTTQNMSANPRVLVIAGRCSRDNLHNKNLEGLQKCWNSLVGIDFRIHTWTFDINLEHIGFQFNYTHRLILRTYARTYDHVLDSSDKTARAVASDVTRQRLYPLARHRTHEWVREPCAVHPFHHWKHNHIRTYVCQDRATAINGFRELWRKPIIHEILKYETTHSANNTWTRNINVRRISTYIYTQARTKSGQNYSHT